MSKTVHQCCREGWYIGPAEADESPLEPGVHLVPANAYEDAPPPRHEWPQDQMPRRSGGQWVMQSPPVLSSATPAEKLAAFLAAHPDVMALIGAES